MVEKAEEYLKKGGLSEVRVRCQGATARIEIPQDELKKFLLKKKYKFTSDTDSEVIAHLLNYFVVYHNDATKALIAVTKNYKVHML